MVSRKNIRSEPLPAIKKMPLDIEGHQNCKFGNRRKRSVHLSNEFTEAQARLMKSLLGFVVIEAK